MDKTLRVLLDVLKEGGESREIKLQVSQMMLEIIVEDSECHERAHHERGKQILVTSLESDADLFGTELREMADRMKEESNVSARQEVYRAIRNSEIDYATAFDRMKATGNTHQEIIDQIGDEENWRTNYASKRTIEELLQHDKEIRDKWDELCNAIPALVGKTIESVTVDAGSLRQLTIAFTDGTSASFVLWKNAEDIREPLMQLSEKS